jgi:hypothetical protein
LLRQLGLVGVQPTAFARIAQQRNEFRLLVSIDAIQIEQGAQRPGLRPHPGVFDAVHRRHVDPSALDDLVSR